MSVGTLAPNPWFTGFDDSGNIVPGGLLSTFLAGTTTNVNTYTDVALTTPNANPIVLDSAGRVPSGFYLTPGVSYKFVLKTAAGVTIRTQDNIGTVPPFEQDVDVGGTAGENLTAGDAVYCSTGTGGDAARTAGRFYKADFSFAYRSTQPLITGFVTSTITTGNTGTFRLAGRVTGLSALTVGGVYWFSTTPGLLTSTSNYASGGRPVGIADSTTTLLTFPQATPHLVSTNVTPVTVASVAETDLMTFSVPAYTLNSNGMMLRATMLGINSGGGAGNRTYRCYFGTDVLALAVLAANGTEWRIEFEITRTAAATQLASVKRHLAAASSFDYASTFTRDTTAAQTLKLTVQGAGATDGATMDMMLIELVTPRVIA
jgi:hypothetical protein